jgi:LruC domain-containing protein
MKFVHYFTILAMTFSLGVSCSNKKKGVPLFLALLAGNQTGESAGAGSSAPEGSQIQELEDGTVVTTLPTENSEGTSSIPPAQVSSSTQDSVGTGTFNFQTTQTIPINIQINDENGPVEGAIVTIYDPSDSENPDILFQQATDSNGTASGSIQVPATTESVTAEVNLGNTIISTPIETQIVNSETGSTDSLLAVDRTFNVSGSHNPTEHFVDSDGDGVPDAYDDYPEDATRATMTRFPRSGVNTLAFEDLFPNAGDADLNDYVVFFNTEEDLNAQGKIVKIRGSFEHVARGAGYSHELYLKLDVPTAAKMTKTSILRRSGSTIHEDSGEISLSTQQLLDGIRILERSNLAMESMQNCYKTQEANPARGDLVNFEISFDEPIARASIGNSPYDVFMRIYGGSNGKVHLAGRYFNENGSDKYLDPNGFPFAIMVPGRWNWPIERRDIRNPDQTGYGDFIEWMESGGTKKRTWYLNITNNSNVFLFPEGSPFAGYLGNAMTGYWISLVIALMMAGFAFGFILIKRKSS